MCQDSSCSESSPLGKSPSVLSGWPPWVHLEQPCLQASGRLQLRGCWRAGQTAGGSSNFASYPCNPCPPFSIPEGAGPHYIQITLQQHCRLSDSQLHSIGFHVFQVPADSENQDTCSLLLQEPLLSCVPHCYAQEVSRLCLLSAGNYRTVPSTYPGNYRIVPSTYLPDTEGTFTVTIATRIDRQSIHSQEMLG